MHPAGASPKPSMSAPLSAAAAASSGPCLPPLRPFGAEPRDLDIEFPRWPRAALTTALLAHCSAEDGRGSRELENCAWDLPLNTRILRLLQLVRSTTDEDGLALMLSCPGTNCRSRYEIVVPFDELTRDTATDATAKIVPFSPAPGTSVELRRPTGRDQARWSEASYSDRDAATQAIVQSLVITPPAGPAAAAGNDGPQCSGDGDSARVAPRSSIGAVIDFDRLAAAMEAADPLVSFSVRTACPDCGEAADVPVDLEAIALERLAQYRRTLVRSVHALATRYGWSEADILRLPARRRAEYLRLIEDEGTAWT